MSEDERDPFEHSETVVGIVDLATATPGRGTADTQLDNL